MERSPESSAADTPPLLLLAPRVTDDSVAVWRAAIAAGWQTERLLNWRVPGNIAAYAGPTVIFAEPLFLEVVAPQIGITADEPSADWLVRLPAELRKRRVWLMPPAEAGELQGPLFIKPAAGKVFEPRVYACGNDLPRVERIGNIAVLVSEPVTFILEVRCFVRDGAVVACSPYWRDGALAQADDGTWPFLNDEEAAARKFADEAIVAAAGISPGAYVLDIGITAEQGWAVIEANPCWGAGLYGCDPMAVLETARAAMHQRSREAD